MTTSELIAQLSTLPPTTKVYLWLDGERIEADSIDVLCDTEAWVDINAKEK